MKINFTYTNKTQIQQTINKKGKNQTNPINGDISPENSNYELAGANIPFGAIHGIKRKRIDTLAEKLNLDKTLENILKEAEQYDPDKIFNKMIREAAEKSKKQIKTRLKKIKKVEDMSEYALFELYTKTIRDFLKQAEITLEKVGLEVEKKKDPNDYKLINQLRTAVLDENTNLEKVYTEYYSGLNEVKTINELHEKYPKIKLPKRPEEVVAKKILDSMPKKFFEEFNQELNTEDSEAINNYLFKAFIERFNQATTPRKIEDKSIINKLYESFIDQTFEHQTKLEQSTGFSSIPENKKVRTITKDEINLLTIDYDKFVIETLRQQYLEGKKLSEIVYTEGNTKIKHTTLANTDFKFDKPDERIKTILKKAKIITQAERDYNNFENNELQERIRHYSTQPKISDNETIFEHLFDFANSKLLDNDRSQLVKLLRLLDDVADNKKTIKEAETIIKNENIRPIDTDRLNELEKEEFIKSSKLAMKAQAEFENYCREYDKAINLLYQSNNDSIANICSIYRPKILGTKHESADKILEILENHMQNGEFINQAEMSAKIKYLDTYYNTTAYDSNNPILAKAIEYSKKHNTKDEVEIGRYIKLSEVIESYPASKPLLSKEDIEIVELLKNYNSELAIEKFIQYDKYKNLEQKEKMSIFKILEHFDIVESKLNKTIIESLINNIYTKEDTQITTYLTPERTTSTTSTMTAGVKEAILQDKKFPLCIEYYKEFEDKMTKMAQRKEDDGIQIIGSNNKTLRKLYKQEVKISYDERLYSTKGDFVFDVYKAGLHKSKTTKA